LADEQPRTIALVLHTLEIGQAGEVLKRLPAELRHQVTVQLGQHPRVDRAVMQRVAQAILAKSQTLEEGDAGEETADPYKKMADMLRVLDKAARMEAVAYLEQQDPAMAAGVKCHLYHFDDLLLLQDQSLQKVLGEVAAKDLALAMKGAAEAVNERVLNNLSSRARDTLTEEMEYLRSIPPTQIQQAQKMIVDVIQRLDQAGDLMMLE
jgi:flagellar motor switch protein FliG